MRGRRPDAASQEVKGNPGKRKRKPTVADRIKLLADAPAVDALGPPTIFGLDEFGGAVAIWREFVPELRRRNIVDDRLDRHTLAMFCYYLDQFWSSVAVLAEGGTTQKVKTVAGGYMLRDHPAVRRRDEAQKIVMDLSTKFGLTPMDRYKLVREMAGTGVPIGDLFNEGRADAQELASDASSDADDMIGFGARHSGRPQLQRPN